jgi:hypothetical protein
MFPMSAPASACRAPCEDRCSFGVLHGCIDLSLELLEATLDRFQLLRFFLSAFGHILYKGED